MKGFQRGQPAAGGKDDRTEDLTRRLCPSDPALDAETGPDRLHAGRPTQPRAVPLIDDLKGSGEID